MSGEFDKVGPVDHIARLALPWRTEAEHTECGKRFDDVDNRLVTVDDVRARVARIGKQRAAFTVCMTCWDTVTRWAGAGGRDTLGAIEREIQGTQYARPPHPGDRNPMKAQRMWARRQRLEAEIEALAALVEAHREEFDGYIAGRAEAVSLADRRRERRMRGVR
jgi:hypothetical protein